MMNMNDIESMRLERKAKLDRVMREGWKNRKEKVRQFAFKNILMKWHSEKKASCHECFDC